MSEIFKGDSADTHWKIFPHIDGGLSGGSCVQGPGNENPIGVRGNLDS